MSDRWKSQDHEEYWLTALASLGEIEETASPELRQRVREAVSSLQTSKKSRIPLPLYWATVAAAVLVLAVALPLLLARKPQTADLASAGPVLRSVVEETMALELGLGATTEEAPLSVEGQLFAEEEKEEMKSAAAPSLEEEFWSLDGRRFRVYIDFSTASDSIQVDEGFFESRQADLADQGVLIERLSEADQERLSALRIEAELQGGVLTVVEMD